MALLSPIPPAAGSAPARGWKTSWLPIALSGLGLMADIYDFNVINLVRPMLEEEYGKMSPMQNSMITSASFGGCMLGMLIIGGLADKVGRRVLSVATALLIGSASLGSALAVATPSLGLDVYSWLIFWRFLMGIGLGGEYPLAAANTAENVDAGHSAQPLALVFSSMALGYILAPLVVMGLVLRPGSTTPGDIWRPAFGVGAVLSLVCAGLRWSLLHETESWRRASDTPPAEATAGTTSSSRSGGVSRSWAVLVHMSRTLLGTCGAWLIFDIVTYGTGLYTTDIFRGDSHASNTRTVLFINAVQAPGFFLGVLVAPHVRLRDLQMFGFFGMILCFLPLAAFWGPLGHVGRLTFFAFGRFFDVLGPGLCTYVIPGQVFPTKVRGTAHGMSAAAGKFGALIGTSLFPLLWDYLGLTAVMGLCAALSLAGLLWTLAFVPAYDSGALKDIEAAERMRNLSDEQLLAAAERRLFAGDGAAFDEALRLWMPGKQKPSC